MMFTQSSWKGAVVTEAEQVQLQALALHHLHVGDVRDAYLGKVRLSGDGAQAGELGAVESYPVVALRMAVVEGLEHLRGIVLPVRGLAAQQGQLVFQFFHEVCIFMFL